MKEIKMEEDESFDEFYAKLKDVAYSTIGAMERLLYLNLKLEATKRLLYLDLNGS